jgi:hypothetical protein
MPPKSRKTNNSLNTAELDVLEEIVAQPYSEETGPATIDKGDSDDDSQVSESDDDDDDDQGNSPKTSRNKSTSRSSTPQFTVVNQIRIRRLPKSGAGLRIDFKDGFEHDPSSFKEVYPNATSVYEAVLAAMALATGTAQDELGNEITEIKELCDILLPDSWDKVRHASSRKYRSAGSRTMLLGPCSDEWWEYLDYGRGELKKLFDDRLARANKKTGSLRPVPNKPTSQNTVRRSSASRGIPLTLKAQTGREHHLRVKTETANVGTTNIKRRGSDIPLPQSKRTATKKYPKQEHPSTKVDRKELPSTPNSVLADPQSQRDILSRGPRQKPEWQSNPIQEKKNASSELVKWKSRCLKLENILTNERRKHADFIMNLESWWSEGSRSLEELLDGYEHGDSGSE